jgi:hypothetical protein
MAASVMRNDPIAALKQEQHLWVPAIRIDRLAMREHHWFSFTLVLEEDLSAVADGVEVHHVDSLIHENYLTG